MDDKNNKGIRIIVDITITLSIVVSIAINFNPFKNILSGSDTDTNPSPQTAEEAMQPPQPPVVDNNLTTGTTESVSTNKIIEKYIIYRDTILEPETTSEEPETPEEPDSIQSNQEPANRDDSYRGATVTDTSNNDSSEESSSNFNINVDEAGQMILVTNSDLDVYGENEVKIREELKTGYNTDISELTYDQYDSSDDENNNENENYDNENDSSEPTVPETDSITDSNNSSDINEDEVSEADNETSEITYNVSDICNYVDDLSSSTITYINVEPGQYEFSFTNCEMDINFYFITDINDLYSEDDSDDNDIIYDEEDEDIDDIIFDEEDEDIDDIIFDEEDEDIDDIIYDEDDIDIDDIQ